MTVQDLIEAFIKSRKYSYSGARKECRPRTIQTYINDLARFLEYLEKVRVENPAQINRDIMLGFRDWLKEQIKTDATRLKVLRAVRALGYFAEKDDLCELHGIPNFRKYLPPIPNTPRCMGVPSNKDVQDFLGAVSKKGFNGLRDTVLINLFLECGPRLGEVTHMQMKHIRQDQLVVMIPEEGKTGFRIVFITEDYSKDLNEYFKERAKKAKCDYVFVQDDGAQLAYEGIKQVFKRMSKRAGLTTTISPHDLRHFFCTTYLRKGGAIEKLADITGHSSLEILRNYYVHLVGVPEAQEELERVSPRKAVENTPRTFKERLKQKYATV